MRRPFLPAPDLSPARPLPPAATTDLVRELVRAEIRAATQPANNPPPTGLELAQRAVSVTADAHSAERLLGEWLFYPDRDTRAAFGLTADHVMLAEESAPIARTWVKNAVSSGAKYFAGNPKPELSDPRTADDLVKEAFWMAAECRLAYWRTPPRELRESTPPDPDEVVVARLIRSWAAHDSRIWETVMPGQDYPIGVVISEDVLEGGDTGRRLTAAIDALIKRGT